LANALGKRTAKTTRGRRILKRREPQIIEEAKTGLIIRGNQCANQVALLLRDLYRLRSPLATLFMRKHPEHPFEDIKKLESMCVKHDHSLFAFGSSSKKRPFRLILGRLFDGHLLDMQEFGVQDYKGISSFPRTVAESSLGSKPLVVFQGASFETDERMKRVKSLLLDWFSGPRPEKILLSGLDQVVVCSVRRAQQAALRVNQLHQHHLSWSGVITCSSSNRAPSCHVLSCMSWARNSH